MITMHTARTSEIDEVDDAIAEIKSQIDFGSLKKYSGGIVFCHMDFVESGIVEKLCEELPIDIIGMTSMASADEHGYGLYDLTLSVLTSDEVSFEVGMTDSITPETFADEIDRFYSDVRSRVDSDPTMILTFMPYMKDISGYELAAAMDKSCNGIPMWGSITNNVDLDYDTVQTICNGKNLRDGIAMMFLNGPVNARFIVSSLPERNIASRRAIITKSKGAVLYEVNDQPLLEYLASIGLMLTKESINTTPLMVYYEGMEEPVALGFYSLLEDGSVLTGGEMSEGTSFAVGSIDREGIFESGEKGLKEILEGEGQQAVLMLPCVTRYVMLSPNQERELHLIEETMSGSGIPYVMGYSGGEICPMEDPNGKLHNRFHNYTFCACVFS